MQDPDFWKFSNADGRMMERMEGRENDSPVDLSGREGAERNPKCPHSNYRAICSLCAIRQPWRKDWPALSDSDLGVYLELALRAFPFKNITADLDLSDGELTRLETQLREYMEFDT